MIRLLLLLIILHLALFSEQAWGSACEPNAVVPEIDWTKIRGTWHDVVDIPRNNGPLCWDTVRIDTINNGIRMTTFEHEYWHHEHSRPIQFEYFHIAGGFYTERSVNITEFNEEVANLMMDWKGEDKPESIHQENDPELQNYSFFLTDYEKYFIAVYCMNPGFRAYVKSPTPSISMEFLNEITKALNGVGLKSPTMTLKIGCMKNGFGLKSPK